MPCLASFPCQGHIGPQDTFGHNCVVSIAMMYFPWVGCKPSSPTQTSCEWMVSAITRMALFLAEMYHSVKDCATSAGPHDKMALTIADPVTSWSSFYGMGTLIPIPHPTLLFLQPGVEYIVLLHKNTKLCPSFLELLQECLSPLKVIIRAGFCTCSQFCTLPYDS